MINVQTAELIVSVAAFVVAYGISTSIAGMFRAYISEKMGDDTAVSQGFLTLNPLMHVDIIGLTCLIFLGIGWGQRVPLDANNIQGPWRGLKLLFIGISETIAYLCMAIISTTILLYSFGKGIFTIMIPMVLRYDLLTHRLLAHAYPAASSLAIVLALIMIAIIYVNAMLATITIIMNSMHWLINRYVDRFEYLSAYTTIIMIAVPLIVLIFLSSPLRLLIIQLICIVGALFGSLVCSL